MKYYFNLLDENYKDLNFFIADASSKQTGINRAKKILKENNIIIAILEVNSMITNNLIDLIYINL